MIRFTLLQARLQIIFALVGLALIGVVLALTAHDIADAAKQCADRSTCDSMGVALPEQYAQLWGLIHGAVITTPGLIGVFWGAPLVSREFDNSTHRLAWTQSVTRTRWLTTKLTCLGLLAIAFTAALSWMVTTWAHQIDAVDASRYVTFDTRDIAPVAHTAFAFTAGVTIGLFTRRVVPAMVIALVIVIACSIAGAYVVRPHLITPLELTAPVKSDAVDALSYTDTDVQLRPFTRMPNALVISTKFIERNGKSTSTLRFDANTPGACAGLFPQSRKMMINGDPALLDEAFASAQSRCFAAVDADYDIRTIYQPASRYWTLQWIESGLYIVIALALGGISVTYLRRYSA